MILTAKHSWLISNLISPDMTPEHKASYGAPCLCVVVVWKGTEILFWVSHNYVTVHYAENLKCQEYLPLEITAGKSHC